MNYVNSYNRNGIQILQLGKEVKIMGFPIYSDVIFAQFKHVGVEVMCLKSSNPLPSPSSFSSSDIK